MPVAREFKREYTRVWVRENRQKRMEAAFMEGQGWIGFCKCGDYFTRPKKLSTDACVKCRRIYARRASRNGDGA